MKKLIFDVESDGLYGEGFAVAYIVLDENNNIIEFDSVMANIEIKNDWVKENVLPSLDTKKVVKTTKELRSIFYKVLQQNNDCEIYSDVNFPVETNFLSDIVRDDLDNRAFNMPYPLYDISTLCDINISREKTFNSALFNNFPQLLNSKSLYELKEHNPLHDSLASAYLLTKNKNILSDYINLNLFK